MGWGLKQDIELVLAKIFTDRGVRIPSAAGHRVIKEVLRGKGVRRNDIAQARKELRIQSDKIDGKYWWVWENEQDPGRMWKKLSGEFWRSLDERKGH